MIRVRGRVLVVDDNLLNLELVTDLLESVGLTVTQAGTAEAGIAMAFAERPDLVLLDIGLPGMDGYEALRRLRADPRTERLPVVALTAFAMLEEQTRALGAGFTACITKPIDTRTLPAAIVRLLQLAKADA